jgi:hypothetical protein
MREACEAAPSGSSLVWRYLDPETFRELSKIRHPDVGGARSVGR